MSSNNPSNVVVNRLSRAAVRRPPDHGPAALVHTGQVEFSFVGFLRGFPTELHLTGRGRFRFLELLEAFDLLVGHVVHSGQRVSLDVDGAVLHPVALPRVRVP